MQDDFTLEAWIKSNTPSLTGMQYWEGSGLLWADVIGEYDDFGASILNNKLAFGVGNSGAALPTIVSVSSVIDNQWTHVAVTRKMSTGCSPCKCWASSSFGPGTVRRSMATRVSNASMA